MSQSIDNPNLSPYTNPLLGKSFESIEAAHQALNRLGAEVGFNMRIFLSRPNRKDATYVLFRSVLPEENGDGKSPANEGKESVVRMSLPSRAQARFPCPVVDVMSCHGAFA